MTERHGERPDTPITEPAPTITSKARSDEWVIDRRTNSKNGRGGMYPTVGVSIDRPAPTLTGKSGGQWILRPNWPYEDPATTVAADPRITARTTHVAGSQGRDARSTQQVQDGDYDGDQPIKLTVEEAAALQSFPVDYPWQGSKSSKFKQIGNAIPPGLGGPVLAKLL